MQEIAESDRAATELLRRLNQQYVDAFMLGDVAWYQDHLTEDFVCIESDGSILDKAGFLRNAALGPDVAAYELVDVRVRLFGPIALIHATGRFIRADGSTGTSRYTDVYALSNGQWKAISAQVTRTQGG